MQPDLNEARALATLEKARRASDAETAALATVAAWDKAMTRTFKGILPRPTRRAMLMRASEQA